MTTFSKYLALSIALLGASLSRADTIFLTDGTEINGTIVTQDASTIVVKTASGATRSIRRSTVDTVVRDTPRPIVKTEAPNVPLVPARATTQSPSAPADTANDTKVPGKSPLAGTGPSTPPPTKFSAPVGLGQGQAPALTGTPPGRTAADIASGAPADAGSLPAADVGKTGLPVPGNQITTTVPPPETPLSSIPEKIEAAPVKTVLPAVEPLGQNPIEGFPDFSKRMSKRKESLFRDALIAIKGTDDVLRETAIADIQGLGAEVVPYLWAGVQNEDASVRIACMKIIGSMGARNCTKRVIETLHMTMPAASQAASWNVPFVRAMKTTVATLTGQSFISVEPKSPAVQEGLKKYIDWYTLNYERLPRQVGEPEVDPTDPDFSKKLSDLRKLKLTKREWSRAGGMPVDLISGPNNTTPGREPLVIKDTAEREVDIKYGESIPKVGRDEANKLGAKPVLDKADAFTREGDVRNDTRIKSTVTERDPPIAGAKPDPVKGSAPKPADALKRPQDLQREEQQK